MYVSFCLQHHNVSLLDFPTHDMSADFVLLSEQRLVEKELREKVEVRVFQLSEVQFFVANLFKNHNLTTWTLHR